MSDTIYRSVNTEHAAYRLFLDGLVLARNGWTKGERYTRTFTGNTFVMKRDPQGRYVVSGKNPKNPSQDIKPVIDVENQKLGEVIQGGQRIKAVVTASEITVTVHHHTDAQNRREADFKAATKRRSFTKGVICAGIGMSTLAMSMAMADNGYKSHTDWVIEREAKYSEIAVRNNPAYDKHTNIITANAEEVAPQDISPVNICQFSLPCTGHCNQGKAATGIVNAEEHETDATAVIGLLNLLSRINAGVYISENVKNARNSATYTLLRATLSLMGYNIVEWELNNTQSGSFENRPRYWFAAVSKGLALNAALPVPSYPRKFKILNDILEPASETCHMWAKNDYLKVKALRDAEKGNGFAKRQLVDGSTTQVGVITRLYAKKQSTGVMLTRDDGQERLLTVLEHARAKQCPESLIRGTNFTVGHEGLGQGIDMMQGYGVTEWMLQAVCEHITSGSKPKEVQQPTEGQMAFF